MNIPFSFIIPTCSTHHSDHNIPRLNLIVDSIEQEQIPQYEIIIVGDGKIDRKNTTVIDFNENIKKGWITRKKNIGAQQAKFDNLVFLHDYIVLYPGWYKGWLKNNNFWEIGVNIIINLDNTRFRDWIAFDDLEEHGTYYFQHRNFPTDIPITTSPHLPPYTYIKTNKMYISGSFWIAKKKIMINNPLNEDLVWGLPEDIEWSMRIRNNHKIIMNTFSAVKLLKYKDPVWKSVNPYYMTYQYITQNLINE